MIGFGLNTGLMVRGSNTLSPSKTYDFTTGSIPSGVTFSRSESRRRFGNTGWYLFALTATTSGCTKP